MGRHGRSEERGAGEAKEVEVERREESKWRRGKQRGQEVQGDTILMKVIKRREERG